VSVSEGKVAFVQSGEMGVGVQVGLQVSNRLAILDTVAGSVRAIPAIGVPCRVRV
jgi:hypothetical protein